MLPSRTYGLLCSGSIPTHTASAGSLIVTLIVTPIVCGSRAFVVVAQRVALVDERRKNLELQMQIEGAVAKATGCCDREETAREELIGALRDVVRVSTRLLLWHPRCTAHTRFLAAFE